MTRPFVYPRLALLVVAASCLALFSCAVRKIDIADPSRGITVGERAPASEAIWPQRPQPTASTFTVKRGEPPRDEGVYKNCRIYRAGEVKDGLALILAGRRWQSLKEQEEPFKLTVVSKRGTNELELKTEDHRLTLAVIRAAKTAKPRGLVIYLASIMLISKEEKAFIRRLQERGWNVAAITPSIDLFAEDRWPTNWDDSQVEEQANLVAREIDNYLAESAYAAEAVLAYLEKEDPRWLQGSRVVIGASAGALAAPALLNRIDPVDAAVFIGGGADMSSILLESALDIYRPEISIQGSDRLSKSEVRRREKAARARFRQLVLERSKLDPAHLAPNLPSTPTLMINGELDRIVPAHTGDLLYRALGKPERWRYPAGHIVLFLTLPYQGNKVADWIEQAVAN